MRSVFRRYFVAGVLFFAPIGITLWAIFWIIGNGVLLRAPARRAAAGSRR